MQTTYGTTYQNDIAINYPATVTTYSPYSNECPISGWDGANVQRTGKNLFQLVESEMVSVGWNRRFPFSIKAGTYTISCQNQFGGTGSKGAQVRLYDGDLTLVTYLANAYSFGLNVFTWTNTITEEQAAKVKYILFECNSSGATYESITNGNIQLEIGPTASAYEAYVGNTYQIDWTDEAGTVYDGQLTVNEDGTGQIESEYIKKTLTGTNSDGTWSRTKSGRFNLDNLDADYYKENLGSSGISSSYKSIPQQTNNALFDTAAENYSAAFCLSSASSASTKTIRIKDTRFDSLDDFKTALASELPTFLIKLATPVTYQLTAEQVITALQGYNAMWADTGDITVTFRGTPVVEPDEQPLQALNLLLGGAYRNNQTQEDVPDEEALDILLGGADR